MTLLSGILTIVVFFFLPETYVPILLHRKAEKLKLETNDMRYWTKFGEDKGGAWKNISVSRSLVLRSRFIAQTNSLMTSLATGHSDSAFQDLLPRAYSDFVDYIVGSFSLTVARLSICFY